jgi:chitodextrinase
LLLMLGTHVSAAPPQPGQLHFTAVGDFAANSNTNAVLDAIATSHSDLTLALGDLSYGTAGAEQTWCDFVTDRVRAGYPFELLAGNHESNGLNGNINDFSACLPNQLPGVVGTYGRQYYVDVPAGDPLVRFIMISPSLGFPDGTYSYPAGSPRYQWTSAAIDGARAAAIPWVVVGMHKPCVTVGRYVCDPGSDLFNLLVSKKVDLILSGHEHNYQRSKQLAHGAGCAAVSPGGYDADCVADADSALTHGAGSVAAIAGTGGNSLYDINAADAEADYFAATSGANSNPTWGALDVVATADSLQASFLRGAGGTFTDGFTISRDTTPNVPPVAEFTSSCTDLTCSFDGSGSTDSDGTISAYAWNFGDGLAGTGATPSHTFTAAGSYTVKLTVTDNLGQAALITHDVNVTAPPVITYASDQFARTVTTGFGTAPIGGVWTNTGAVGNLSVSAGTGNIRLDAGAKQSVYLASANAPQADMLLRFGLDKPPTGGGVQVAAYGRRVAGQGGYAGKAKLSSSGAVNVEIVRQDSAGAETVIQTAAPSGVTYAVGDLLNLRVQVLNTAPAATIRTRVWKVGTPEPSTWLRSVTDSTAGLQAPGSIGVLVYNSSSATNAPLTVKLDDLIVTAP